MHVVLRQSDDKAPLQTSLAFELVAAKAVDRCCAASSLFVGSLQQLVGTNRHYEMTQAHWLTSADGIILL